MRRSGRVGASHVAEGVGEQGVARENGRGFVEGLVAGGMPTAQIVVVHGGQIVVNERVGVNHFKSCGKGQQGFGDVFGPVFGAGAGHGQAEHGPQSLASGKQAVAHGVGKPGRYFLVEKRGGEILFHSAAKICGHMSPL